jgi:hypothetical protein
MCSVSLLDPRRYRLKSSSSGIGRSFRVLHLPQYRPYWFCDPALPLAPYPGCAVFPLQATADDCLGYRPRPLVELRLPLESYPAIPTRPSQRPSPLMGSRSLQHLRHSRSTHHESSRPATFRLQGLVTLLTGYSLESRAGFVSHRQRSWDSPFGGFLSRKISAAFRPGRTHVPLVQRYFRRRSVRPARRTSVSGFTPRRSTL